MTADGKGPGLIAVMLAVPVPTAVFAGTLAVNCVALTKVVVNAVPFQATVAPERKAEPFTVSVNGSPDPVTVAGLRLVIAGGGLMASSVALVEVAPAVTVIAALPVVAIRAAVTAVVSCVALTNFVTSAVPFHATVFPVANPAPFTVRVKAAPPAAAEDGLSDVIVGGPLTANVTALEDAPPKFT
jgi:hypothetical protein